MLYEGLHTNELSPVLVKVLKNLTRHDGSSRPEVFCKKGILTNFAKFAAKHLCQSLFFNKVAGLRPELMIQNARKYKKSKSLTHIFKRFIENKHCT